MNCLKPLKNCSLCKGACREVANDSDSDGGCGNHSGDAGSTVQSAERRILNLPYGSRMSVYFFLWNQKDGYHTGGSQKNSGIYKN